MSSPSLDALRQYIADLRKMATREPVVIDPEKLADTIEQYIRDKEGSVVWVEAEDWNPENGTSAN